MTVDLGEFDEIGRKVPVLVDLKPSGTHYMEHFHWAGGVPRLLRELREHLALDAVTVSGRTIGEIADEAENIPTQTIIRHLDDPVHPGGGMAVLRGNLAPDGAVIKHSAASPELLIHTGRAVVFDSVEDLTSRIDDPELDVNADDILVLRNAGPKGAPGMPEAGYLPIPKKLAQAGVKDMVRISDARMSGTAFGTIVLHIAPEAAVGGPLALVRTGDRIRLDVPERRLELLVPEDERRRRAQEWRPPAQVAEEHRGYRGLYMRSVLQADQGCDFDFC
jgi:dihydroxy-acid dehydratase